jgi:predicted nucleic acid-binding protein
MGLWWDCDYLVDTSGIVKRYIHETGMVWVQNLTDAAARNLIYLARITEVEVTSAVARRQRGGSLSAQDAAAMLAQFRQDLILEYRIIEITPTLLSGAAALAQGHGLRAYDAVQLAAALQLNHLRSAVAMSTVTLVSADLDLNAAAIAEGLQVEDPNTHP